VFSRMTLRCLSCALICQVVFYWTLLARHISQYFEANPDLKPVVSDRARPIRQVNLSAQQEEQITEIFYLFDTDGGGTIDRQELKVAMTALGFQDTRKEQGRGKHGRSDGELKMEVVDTDASDFVSLEEFRSLMKGELTMSDPLEVVKAVFVAISSMEGDPSSQPDVITLSRLRAAAHKFGVRFSDDELQMMMVEVDIGGDHTVSEEEFMRIMILTPWF
jgi:Ca2+-binding EF-hand superfamily protein